MNLVQVRLILCSDTLYVNDAMLQKKAELFVIHSSAIAGFFLPLTTANTGLFSQVNLVPSFVQPEKGRKKKPFLDRGDTESSFNFCLLAVRAVVQMRLNTHYTGYLGLRISWRQLEINLHKPPWSLFSPFLSFFSFIFFPVNMAERVHPQRAFWVIKKRA